MTAYFIAVGLGLAQLGLGLLLGAWWIRRRSCRAADDAWVRELVERCRKLTGTAADDVDQFRTQLVESTERLATTQGGSNLRSPAHVAEVVNVVNDVIALNEKLHEKLATTEKKLHQQSEQLESYLSEARTDALTRLPNRRALDDELHRQYARWQRRHSPLSVLLIDVDLFKKFNDQHGHRAGDAVLRGVAEVLQDTMRDCDLVARFGGEEFAVVLPDTDGERAKIAAERARRGVHVASFVHESVELAVTVSVGAAELNVYDDLHSLLERADQALYTSKRAGRNCGHFHNGQWCEPITEDLSAATAGPPVVASPAPFSPTAPVPVHPELAEACQDLRERLVEVAS